MLRKLRLTRSPSSMSIVFLGEPLPGPQGDAQPHPDPCLLCGCSAARARGAWSGAGWGLRRQVQRTAARTHLKQQSEARARDAPEATEFITG
ncbi:hypothetical protein NDU88_005054 [Pleurodeles waltl]|uniref:Uncharacterized protein n=1 Tax=Pleurodeles waltl TaxID=8319 RepID=A0AAV7L2L5_PLEWA|nr:hypothetical protein NDU88_005054 [Pleurodeles waltl]